jgi:monoterpene epsilon-lactone hydrolase
MQDRENTVVTKPRRVPWNKGKLIGAKPPLRPKHVWSIRTKLQVEGRTRDLARPQGARKIQVNQDQDEIRLPAYCSGESKRRQLVASPERKAMDGGEIDAVRALLSSKPRPVGWVQRRERLDEVGSIWPVADDVSLGSVDLDGVPGEWSIAPGSGATRVLLFFHGGGYCSGSILSHRRMVTEAGRAAGSRTLAVGYRLAPEHPFPAALEDALTAWHYVRNQGVAAGRIAVGGDSAGGGLTVALINRLRDAGEELPGCAWLVSPWMDLTMSGETLATKDAVDPIIHEGYLGELADAYLPAGTDRKDPQVSPLYADLKGLPPALIQVGSAETLLADATHFAAAAGAADVRVTLEIWPHMIHAWHLWNAHLEPGRRALTNAGSFIRECL